MDDRRLLGLRWKVVRHRQTEAFAWLGRVCAFVVFAAGPTSLEACGTSSAPVSIQTCDVVEGKYPANGPSYAHLTLMNETTETINDIVVFVTYTNNSYGFPINVRQSVQPRRSLRWSHRLSEDQTLRMNGGKWEYSCWLESATFANGRRWSGAVRPHWPRT